jgi:hypothetical protein
MQCLHQCYTKQAHVAFQLDLSAAAAAACHGCPPPLPTMQKVWCTRPAATAAHKHASRRTPQAGGSTDLTSHPIHDSQPTPDAHTRCMNGAGANMPADITHPTQTNTALRPLQLPAPAHCLHLAEEGTPQQQRPGLQGSSHTQSSAGLSAAA